VIIIPLNDTLIKWSKNTLLVRPFLGFDSYASPIWASSTAEVSYPALIDNTARMVRDQKGALVTSPTQIFLAGDPGIRLEDKITLPDGSQPLIQSIQYNDDFDGNQCYVVIFT
jgi:hypothetical protein